MLKKTVSFNESYCAYQTSQKQKVPLTHDSSPCNVSKNMMKVNQKYTSKKFFQGIESESIQSTHYEILKKGQNVTHRDTSKENNGVLNVQTEKRKPPKSGKKKLYRGMTVKFQDDESILQHVEKNKELVRKYCKTKSFRKKSVRARMVSENSRPIR